MTPGISNDEFAPPEYAVIRKDRPTRGGGVALLISKSIPFVVLPDVIGAEAVFCKIHCDGISIVTGCVYRSPSSDNECIIAIQEYLQTHAHNSRLIIMGDFNLPDINWNNMQYTSQSSETLIDLILNFNLQQVVLEPTRIKEQTKSILDLILISGQFSLNKSVVNVIPGISDHRIPICQLQLGYDITPRSSATTVRNFPKGDDASIVTYLAHEFENFSNLAIHPTTDVNHLWSCFKTIVVFCVTHFVPLKTKRQKKHNPWITREVLHAKRKVKRLRQAIKKKGKNPVTASNLARAITDFKQKANFAKRQYFTSTLPCYIKNNPHRFWKHFRPAAETKSCLSDSDKTNQANIFNDYFQSVFTDDNGTTPAALPTARIPIEPLVISDTGILNLLLNLDTKKASGHDDIANEFLFRYAELCSKYLGIIYRKSIETAKLPSEWKVAKVIPIHKTGDTAVPSNFRPISLTSTSCKILEHIIAKHLTIFLENNNLLSPHQHGFRKGLSTITQLTEVVHDLALSINNRGQTDIILLDLAKAFDRVCHTKLISKLQNIIGDGEITNWVRDFLINRSQFVVFEGASSRTAPVKSGVPQGSVLGPLLFLIYINDITDNIDCKIKLFADDCIIYRVINSSDDHLSLNISLSKIAHWCEQWQMSINLTKTVCMTVTRKKEPSDFTYTINGVPLQRVTQQKYLGVTLTSELRWDAHINNVTASALRKLFFLRRRLPFAPTDTRLLTYTTFVRPILEYANTVWFPQGVTNIAKVERVQRKAIRFIHNKYKRTDSPTNLLETSGLPTLATRAKIARLKFLHHILHNHSRIDASRYISLAESRTLRHKHAYTIKEYASNNDCFKHSFFPLSISEWNRLDPSITNAQSLAEFTSKIETILSI